LALREVKQVNRLPGHKLRGNLNHLPRNIAAADFAIARSPRRLRTRIGGATRNSVISIVSLQRPAKRKFKQSIAACAALTISLASACKDNGITGIASADNTIDTVTVYALTGAPVTLPAAYYFITQSLVRPQITASGGVNFELAFDITSDGRAALIPARIAVPDSPVAAPRVALQKSTIPFDQLLRAPDKGYIDSTAFASVGDTYIVQLLTSGCTYGEPVYAKVELDSILPAERRIVFRTIINRNCGFRSLTVGLPTN
jgi:hypothetical protein